MTPDDHGRPDPIVAVRSDTLVFVYGTPNRGPRIPENSRGSKKGFPLITLYIKNDDFPYEAWHYLGLNYGKIKKFDLSSYALAEKYLLVNELKNAKIHIKRVKKISKDKVLLNKVTDLEKEIRKRENR